MAEDQTKAPLELKYSHNIIEHLGLKLYQNKPTNVIAELISNAWDADAKEVWVDILDHTVCVGDNGVGMSYDDLAEHYLIIGKKKRNNDIKETSGLGRYLMGRKGIGKLAPYGIARKISVFTISKETKKCNLLVFHLNEILKNDDNEFEGKYKPKHIYSDFSVDKVIESEKHKKNSLINKFISNNLESQSEPKGTLIIMEELSIKKNLNIASLSKSMCDRFTVTLALLNK